ncbi:hypothetical protein SORBI_3002G295400 [Sorghum bicolor]|uniref:NAC domain-containing protein n=1 Tax=Sorghum bicolor TaxID=4558 RepID=A0A1W0W6A5_SORBI|nr:hypothetical protein SORBI_3002G295400 [Sorghum bicolor]
MSAADALGLPPGVRFDPTPEELVEFYLMPRALGQPTAVPGIIIEDAEATTSSRHPWKLLTRNRRTEDDEAYFFERVASGDDARGGAARQDRSCGGGRWTWVGQKRFPDQVLPLPLPLRGEAEQVSWGKYSLNLQEGRRRKGGSTGWVMHEYTIAPPRCPPCPVKLCHVAFTGHGQKRQRVPDDDGEGEELEAGTGMPQHKRVATGTGSTPSSSVITTATPDHGGLGAAHLQNQEEPFPNYYETSSSCPPIQPVSDDGAYHEELPMDQVSCTTEQSSGDMDDLPEFFEGWGDLDTFTDTSGVQDSDYGMAAGILADGGPGDGTFAVTA